MARAFDAPESEAVALGSIGIARFRSGDPGGLDDLLATAELHDRMRSVHADLSWSNYSTVLGWAGDLRRSALAAESSRRATQRYRTSDFDERWLTIELATMNWWAGRWEATAETVAEVIADAGEQPHLLLGRCLLLRGRMRLLAGDLPGALTDAEHSLERAEVLEDLDELDSAKAFRARVLLAAGSSDEARKAADELLAGLRGRLLVAEVGADLPIVLAGLGYPAGALDGLGLLQTRWLAAARWAMASSGWEPMASYSAAAAARSPASQALAAASQRVSSSPRPSRASAG